MITRTSPTIGGRPVSRLMKKFSFSGFFAWSVLFFLLLPSLIIIPVSFGNRDKIEFPPTVFQLDLYRTFFTSSNWVATAVQSTTIGLVSTLLALVLGTLAAYAIERSRMRGKQLLLIVLLSPLLVPGVVTALGLYSYLAAIGLAGTTIGLIIGHSVYLCPFVIVTVSSGVRELDGNIEIAAEVMGASRSRIFTDVVLPQLRPSLMSAGLFAFLMSFDELIISWFISSPSTMTLPVKMYSSVQTETSPILAAVSTMLTVLSVAICLGAEAIRKARAKPPIV